MTCAVEWRMNAEPLGIGRLDRGQDRARVHRRVQIDDPVAELGADDALLELALALTKIERFARSDMGAPF